MLSTPLSTSTGPTLEHRDREFEKIADYRTAQGRVASARIESIVVDYIVISVFMEMFQEKPFRAPASRKRKRGDASFGL